MTFAFAMIKECISFGKVCIKLKLNQKKKIHPFLKNFEKEIIKDSLSGSLTFVGHKDEYGSFPPPT